MRAITLILFYFIFSSLGNAQSFKDIIDNYEKNLNKTENFYVDANYKLFEDYESNKILEEFKGVCIKHNKSYYSKIGPTEYVFTKDVSLKISHNEKLVLITQSPLDQDTFLEGTIGLDMLKYFDEEKLEDKGKYWSCSYIPKPSTNLPYKRVILNISKEGYNMIKQILYFSSPILHGFKGKDQYVKSQRLEIEMKNYKTDIKNHINKFQLKTYLNPVGNDYEATGIISGYRVINALNK